jgi:hypothetical protein
VRWWRRRRCLVLHSQRGLYLARDKKAVGSREQSSEKIWRQCCGVAVPRAYHQATARLWDAGLYNSDPGSAWENRCREGKMSLLLPRGPKGASLNDDWQRCRMDNKTAGIGLSAWVGNAAGTASVLGCKCEIRMMNMSEDRDRIAVSLAIPRV